MREWGEGYTSEDWEKGNIRRREGEMTRNRVIPGAKGKKNV